MLQLVHIHSWNSNLPNFLLVGLVLQYDIIIKADSYDMGQNLVSNSSQLEYGPGLH